MHAHTGIISGYTPWAVREKDEASQVCDLFVRLLASSLEWVCVKSANAQGVLGDGSPALSPSDPHMPTFMRFVSACLGELAVAVRLQWPGLFDTLGEMLARARQGESPLRSRSSLLLARHTFRAVHVVFKRSRLSIARHPPDFALMEGLMARAASVLFSTTMEFAIQSNGLLLEAVRSGSIPAADLRLLADTALFSTKCVRQLFLVLFDASLPSFNDSHENVDLPFVSAAQQTVQSAAPAILTMLSNTAGVIASVPPAQADAASLRKLTQLMSGMLVEAQVAHPRGFLPFLAPVLGFFTTVVQNATALLQQQFSQQAAQQPPQPASMLARFHIPYEKLLINALLFMRQVLSAHGSYHVPPPSTSGRVCMADDASDDYERAHVLVRQIFNRDYVRQLVLSLARVLMILGHVNMGGGDEHDFADSHGVERLFFTLQHVRAEERVRPAARALLYVVVCTCKDDAVPLLVQELQQLVASSRANANGAVSQGTGLEALQREAFYYALHVAHAQLGEALPTELFRAWLDRFLAPELTQSPFPFLRRRVALVLAEWIDFIPDTQFGPCLSALLGSVSSDTSSFVRLSAAFALQRIAISLPYRSSPDKSDEVSAFFAKQVTPPALDALFVLIDDARDTESHVFILDGCIATLVECASEHITPELCAALSSRVVALWQRCAAASPPQALLQSSLIRLVSSAVRAAGGAPLRSLYIPLLRMCCVPSDDASALRVHSLDLWRSCTAGESQMPRELAVLFQQQLLPLHTVVCGLDNSSTSGAIGAALGDELSSYLRALNSTVMLGGTALVQGTQSALISSLWNISKCLQTWCKQEFEPSDVSSQMPLLSENSDEEEETSRASGSSSASSSRTRFFWSASSFIGVLESVYRAMLQPLGGAPALVDFESYARALEAPIAWVLDMALLLSAPVAKALVRESLSFLAHLFFNHHAGMLRFVEAYAASRGAPPNTVMLRLIDNWIGVTASMPAVYNRVYVATTLARLTATNDETVLQRVGAIVSMCAKVSGDLARSARTGPLGADATPESAKNELRRRSMAHEHAKRRVMQVDLAAELRSSLATCAQRVGPPVYMQVLQQIDPALRQQLQLAQLAQ